MKFNLKKTTTMALLLLAPMMLTACGGSGSSESKTNADGQLIVTLGQQTLDNSKLPEGDSYEDNAYRRLVEETYDVDLESAFEANGDEYDRQVSLAIASGEIPDMMTVNLEQLKELAENDLIEDLSDVYDEYASDYIKEVYGSFDDIQLEAATVDGKLMGIPGTANDFGPNIVWIRQDWLDKLNIKLDADGNHAITLDELESTAKQFKEQDVGGTGKTQGLALANYLTADSHGGSAYTANPIFNANGAYPKVYLSQSDGSLEYGSNTDGSKAALTYLKKLYDEGVLDNQFGTRTFDDITAMLVNNELGIVTGPWHLPDWDLVQVRTANPTATFTPYAMEDANGKVNSVQKTGVSSFVVVRKGFEKPELAMQIVDLIYDDIANSSSVENEYPEIYAYQQAAVDGSVRPFNIEIFENGSEIAGAVEASEAAQGIISMDSITNFGTLETAKTIKEYLDDPENAEPTNWAVYESRLMAVDGVMNGVRQTDSYNEVNPVVLFDSLKASERNGAQLQKLEEETFIKFITGEESLDKFAEYKETWNNQGGTAILEEMQEKVSEK